MSNLLKALMDNPAMLATVAAFVATLIVWLVKRAGYNTDADALKKWVVGAISGAVLYAAPIVVAGAAWTVEQWWGLLMAIIGGSGLYQAKKQLVSFWANTAQPGGR